MDTAIIVIQVVTLILIIVSVLLQQKGQGLSAVFGGGSGYYKTKRGAEKFLFWMTGVSAFVFLSSDAFFLFRALSKTHLRIPPTNIAAVE